MNGYAVSIRLKQGSRDVLQSTVPHGAGYKERRRISDAVLYQGLSGCAGRLRSNRSGPDRRHPNSPPSSGIGKGASLKGAQGLMQLMPQTTAHLGASARIRLMTRSGSVLFRVLAEYAEIRGRGRTTAVCCFFGYTKMPRLCAGDDTACDCCVGATDFGLLAGEDGASSGVERHEDKIINATRPLTMECLLQSPCYKPPEAQLSQS